jgi:hypothetical protein
VGCSRTAVSGVSAGSHVEYDDSVGSLQVDAKAAGTGGQEKREIGRAGSVEMLDRLLAQVGRNRPVEALEDKSAGRHVVGDNVEEPDHLGEDEHSMAVGSEALKQLV